MAIDWEELLGCTTNLQEAYDDLVIDAYDKMVEEERREQQQMEEQRRAEQAAKKDLAPAEVCDDALPPESSPDADPAPDIFFCPPHSDNDDDDNDMPF